MTDAIREKFEAEWEVFCRNAACMNTFPGHKSIATHFYAQGRADMREEAPKKKYTTKNLWSLLRNLLSQGAVIHKDYDAGNFGSYEMFSAKLDEVARDKEDEIMELLALGKEQQS